MNTHLDFLSKAIQYYHPNDKFQKYYNRVPKMRDETFIFCLNHVNVNTEKKVILELGTSRSFVDGRFPGCNSDDPKYWEPNHPEKWDWSAGCFTRFFAEHSNKTNQIITVDIDWRHINRCKLMTKDFSNINYVVSSSEEVLSKMPPSSIDLLYLDTGDMTPIEQTAQLHLREAKLIIERNILKDDGIILIDDVRNPIAMEQHDSSSHYGKAKYSIPYFLQNGFEIIIDEYQVLLKKTQLNNNLL